MRNFPFSRTRVFPLYLSFACGCLRWFWASRWASFRTNKSFPSLCPEKSARGSVSFPKFSSIIYESRFHWVIIEFWKLPSLRYTCHLFGRCFLRRLQSRPRGDLYDDRSHLHRWDVLRFPGEPHRHRSQLCGDPGRNHQLHCDDSRIPGADFRRKTHRRKREKWKKKNKNKKCRFLPIFFSFFFLRKMKNK